jgi:hypothetical protein
LSSRRRSISRSRSSASFSILIVSLDLPPLAPLDRERFLLVLAPLCGEAISSATVLGASDSASVVVSIFDSLSTADAVWALATASCSPWLDPEILASASLIARSHFTSLKPSGRQYRFVNFIALESSLFLPVCIGENGRTRESNLPFSVWRPKRRGWSRCRTVYTYG